MAWYEKNGFPGGKEKYEIDYGSLEIDVHRNGKKYLTGFVIYPREFIADYLWNRYKKRLPVPKRIQAVAIDAGVRVEILSVDFLKSGSFVVEGMEKDLIFPQFCRRRGENVRYLVRRFKFKQTALIRKGDEVYDFEGNRRSKIRLGRKRGTVGIGKE